MWKDVRFCLASFYRAVQMIDSVEKLMAGLLIIMFIVALGLVWNGGESQVMASTVLVGFMATFSFGAYSLGMAAGRLQMLTAAAHQSGIDQSLAKLWQHIFVPALLGESTFGISASELFLDRASLEVLADSIPEVREKALEDVAAARAFVILDRFQEAMTAYDAAVQRIGDNSSIGKLIAIERKALQGAPGDSLEESLAILRATSSLLHPVTEIPRPAEDKKPGFAPLAEPKAVAVPEMVAPLTRLEKERLRTLEWMASQSIRVILIAGGLAVDPSLPCYVPVVQACPPPLNGLAVPPAGVSQVPTPLSR
jgi:hypothetical protein